MERNWIRQKYPYENWGSSIDLSLRVCLVVRRESGESESERVKMENKDNDGKVKFVGPIKSVRQREKVRKFVSSEIY